MSGFTLETLPRLGGRLCLDFANTAVFDGEAMIRDYFNTSVDLLIWGQRAGLLDAIEAGRLARKPTSQGMLKPAKLLRHSIRLLALQRIEAADTDARRKALALLNKALTHCTGTKLAFVGGRLRLAGHPHGADWLTPAVAFSAAELLTSEDRSRVKRCRGSGCGWIFLDDSRGQRRQWCAMALCGNREKAARHFQRSKDKELTEGRRR